MHNSPMRPFKYITEISSVAVTGVTDVKFVFVPKKFHLRVGKISESTFRAIIYASEACFRFLICCSVSKLEHFKSDWCR